MTGSQTIGKIAAALIKAQRNMGDATKGAKNPFFKSTYADLNSIREVVTSALNAEGISLWQPTITLGDKNYVETVLLHESGEWIAGITQIVNVKGDAQSEGSGISYARRYGLQSLCNVGAVDDDGEAAQGRKAEIPKSVAKPATNGNNNWHAEEKIRAPILTVTPTPQVSTTIQKPTGTGFAAGNGTIQSQGVAVKDAITGAFKVLEAQKKITKEAFKMNYLQGKGISTLAPSELPGIYEKLKRDFPHLNGSK